MKSQRYQMICYFMFFGSVTQEQFAGLTVIAVGDLFQLPPVRDRLVHSSDRNTLRNFDPLWKRFRLCELNEIIRQRGESISLLIF